MSTTCDYLLRMREKQDIQGKARQILRLLMRANGGAVTHRLIHYHLYESHGLEIPLNVRFYITHIRTITGLGIQHWLTERCYALDPTLNKHWCVPAVWEVVGE